MIEEYVVRLQGVVIRRSADLLLILRYCDEQFGNAFINNYCNYIGCVGMSWTDHNERIDITREWR